MRKEFRTFIAFSAAAVSIMALPALGAEVDTVRVTVPFEFTAGGTTLPAGDYVVSEQSDGHVLTIAGKGGDVIMMAWPGSSPEAKTSTLTFEKTSKGAMLREVHMSGTSSDIVRYPSK